MRLGSASLRRAISCLRKRRMAGAGKFKLTNKTKLMQHQQVIENSVTNGQGGRGTYLKADEDVLYSKFPENYRPYGSYDSGNDGQTTPLAVQLGDGTSSTSFSRDWQPAKKGR